MSSVITPNVLHRRVSFGNPALGTYNGVVYTVSNGDPNKAASDDDDDDDIPGQCGGKPLIEGAEAVSKMVAMVNVPPEHVPESLLNLIRSHRPFIEHVRVVIAENDESSIPEHDDKMNQNMEYISEGKDVISSPLSSKSAMENETSALSSDFPESNDLSLIDEEGHKSGRTYLVLFQMSSEEDADTFVEDLSGKPFIAFDDQDLCSVEHVVALQGEDGVSLLNPHFAPPMAVVNSIAADASGGGSTSKAKSLKSSPDSNSNKTGNIMEDQNCAVCLDRLSLYPDDQQSAKAAILTTVCNHTFHLDCLRQWSGPCIVCRFDHSGLNETLSRCHVCGTTEHNYVCLICGIVSCVNAVGAGEGVARLSGDDRSTLSVPNQHFHSSHAGQHYTETLHAYALDTQNQHVYDFAGQGYVHRLVQNKEDGKLVEINDPYSSSQERSLTPGLSDAQEGEVVHRKLEGFASQYYTLLKSQLEQQRTFYEGRLQELRREFSMKERDHKDSKTELLSVLRQERKQLAQRLQSIQRKTEKTLDDAAFLRNMNESLETNKPCLEKRIQEAQREQIASREMIQKYIPALEEKVTTLMLKLEGSMEHQSTKVS
ncbi:zinc finger type UBF domain containing protein [Nitzschia inconspicua]|uniref:Zinc finger type UBF domain containing protein n=1 Tax=Nitzschia inconspicua TaxID=303405 RepID=A0A9K3LVC3_9STRA|nr:zinc finger type UBF domain containing protein [Nitzschia inconspicua]